jgi:hypothetical protein
MKHSASSIGRRKYEKPLICSLRQIGCLLFIFVCFYVRLLWTVSTGAHQDVVVSENSMQNEMIAAKSRVVKLRTKVSESINNGDFSDMQDDSKVITIGFATTVTGCGKDPYTEGAAILKHGIHLASIHGNMGGRYDYKLYVLYHPSAVECTLPLADLGYELLPRTTPVNVSDIKGDFLREHIGLNGCCGEKELIKLEAFTLTQHPIIVHLDLDVIILKKMDTVFDLMLASPENRDTSKVPLMWPDRLLPRTINIFWTKDYNVVAPRRRDKPTQGGLLIIRPNRTVYDQFIDIVREGNYQQQTGWGGNRTKVGPFYGGMTIQGLIPYYYEYLHPDHEGGGVELNRCIYNQMSDHPSNENGRCRTGQEAEECEDCRKRPLNDIVTAHFTICQKPWKCLPFKQDRGTSRDFLGGIASCDFLCLFVRQLIHKFARS